MEGHPARCTGRDASRWQWTDVADIALGGNLYLDILPAHLAPGQRPNLSQAIRRGVAQLTLIDGVDTRAIGAALISGDPFYREATDINVSDVQRALGLLFPGAGDGLSALEPDLIGEHHVAEVTNAGLLDVSLAWAGDKDSERRQILTVLQARP